MHITKQNRIEENPATKLAWCAENSHEVEAVYAVTPFDDLCAKDEREQSSATEQEEKRIQAEAVRRLLLYLFKDVPNALEALKKLYVLAYTICPEVLGQFGTLDKMAKMFSQTRQAFSKKMLNLNRELNLRARNQKSESAVQTYRELTTEKHAERIADERAERRREYQAAWRRAHAAEIRAYQIQYRARFKDRLNRKRREERAGKGK